MLKRWLRKEISNKFPDIEFDVLTPPDEKMGDYSINLVFMLAKREKTDPMSAGKKLIGEFSGNKEMGKYFSKIQLVPPGYINFYLNEDFLKSVLTKISEEKDGYGSSATGKGAKINLEFVSANPTGPLTVGNARAASFGDTLGNVLKKSGYDVTKEYYINDVGNQVNKYAQSVIERSKEFKGEKFSMENLYTSGVTETTRSVVGILGKNLDDKFDQVLEESVKENIKKEKNSLNNLGVKFDEWFRESSLHKSGEVKEVLAELESRGVVVEEDGAKWLKINDEQKAVLVKSDGETTYLANDIAYTRNKFERGFTSVINIWGSDHHGDVVRLKSGVAVLGYDPDRLEILLHQLVALKKDGESVRMSKRKGNIETLDDLLAEAGKDVVRLFFLTRDLNTHMEFDIDLAKKESKENPVYYIQYAFARLNSIFAKAQGTKPNHADKIKEEEELKLLKDLIKFPEIIEDISKNYQVHHLAQYTFNLAGDFHKFYEKHHVIQENDPELQSARILLVRGVHIVLKICLDLMGLATPERM